MVPHLAGIVEDFLLGGAVLRAERGLRDLFQLHVGILGARDQLVERVDIGLVVLVIVEADGARGDGRLQRGFVPRQWRKYEWSGHGSVLQERVILDRKSPTAPAVPAKAQIRERDALRPICVGRRRRNSRRSMDKSACRTADKDSEIS
ncbi:MAG: hypothetical protein WDN03_00850 [Rhizomicrobium sp.]